MYDFKPLILFSDATLSDALTILDKEVDAQIVLVIGHGNKLIGTVTDGDIRRGLLNGYTLKSPVSDVMYENFKSIQSGATLNDITSTFDEHGIKQLPELSKDGELVNLHLKGEHEKIETPQMDVVIMAGGLGTRLSPLTNSCPKPMLKIGDKPILQVIIENMRSQGFIKFFISLNYLGEQIVDHFGDGSAFDVQIEYIYEKDRLGTAGALGLLPESVSNQDGGCLILNGDVITNVDFNHLINFHSNNKADATMCVRDYSMQIPFGEVIIEGNKVLDIQEKPIKNFFVNAGVYVIELKLLKKIEQNQYLDMPDFFNQLLLEKNNITAFPIHE